MDTGFEICGAPLQAPSIHEPATLHGREFASPAARTAVLDGELCLIDVTGGSNFARLHVNMRSRWPGEDDLMFFAFDLLHQDGVDPQGAPALGAQTGPAPGVRQVARALLEGGADLPERRTAPRALRKIWL